MILSKDGRMTTINGKKHGVRKVVNIINIAFIIYFLTLILGCSNPTNTENSLYAPTGITVAASSTTNQVTIKWTDNDSAYYWVYYNKTNDSSTATCATRFSSSGTYGYDVALAETGTYYFWVKSSDGNSKTSVTSDFSVAASFDFTYVSLTIPTGITVAASSTTNQVKIKWTNNGSAYYWVYYSKSNDSSTATCATRFSSSGTYGYDVALAETGTYYFWVKSSDGNSKTSVTSDFSVAASFDFTYVN